RTGHRSWAGWSVVVVPLPVGEADGATLPEGVEVSEGEPPGPPEPPEPPVACEAPDPEDGAVPPLPQAESASAMARAPATRAGLRRRRDPAVLVGRVIEPPPWGRRGRGSSDPINPARDLTRVGSRDLASHRRAAVPALQTGVGAGASQQPVEPEPADELVVAVSTDQQVVADPALHDVVARPREHEVVAAERVDHVVAAFRA